jgi:hypothetical protein
MPKKGKNMTSKILVSIIAFVSGAFAHAQTTASANTINDIQEDNSQRLVNSIPPGRTKALSMAVYSGAVEIVPGATVQITEEIHQILIQANRFQKKYEHPVLVFKDSQILINDPKKLELVLARPGQTMTSI